MSTNDKYELIGGVLYDTPVDETTEQIQSEYFVKAKQVADLLLSSKLKDVYDIIKNIDEETRNYMNSPLVDFLYNWDHRYWVSYAADSGRLKVIKYFVSVGLDIHEDDNMALQAAAKYGKLAIVKYLIELGTTMEERRWALYDAIERGQLDIVKCLVVAGISESYCSEALKWAADGWLKIVKYFVEEVGVDLTKYGRDAMESALCHGYYGIVKYLEEHGVVRQSI